MNKSEISQLRSLVYEALKSTKTYIDFGGDSANLKVLAAFFKWPDVIQSLFDYMENKEGALDQCVSDIGVIAIEPLKVLLEALLERYEFDADVKARYTRVLAEPIDYKNMANIVRARKAYISILSQIVEEVSNANPDSRRSQ